MRLMFIVRVLVLLLLMVGTASAYSPGLKLEKTVSSTNYDHIGQIITYTYSVTNSGDVKLSGPITVTDNKIGKFTIKIKDLAPGATLKFNGNYRITVNDLKKGSVTNLASAAGTYNKRQVTSKTISRTITLIKKPHLTIEKSASSTSYDHVGQTITYTYKITNSGSFKISGPLTVTDNKIGTLKLKNKEILPGTTLKFTAPYRIKDQDLKAGSVTNLASASGMYNKQKVESDSVSVTIKAKFPLKIEKSASTTTYDRVGQIITYTYKVTNLAGFKISGPLTVTDNKIGTITLNTKDLASGRSVTGYATYKITDQDLKAGSVTNLASATGIYNKQKVISNTAALTIRTNDKPDQNLAMIIEKSASPVIYSYEGQIINYSYKVTNSGKIKISGPINVTDNKIGTFTISAGDLAPGTVVYGSSVYKITDQDFKADSVTNLAYATGSIIILPNGENPAANNINIVGCIRKIVTSNETQVTIRKRIDVPEFPSIILPIISIVGILFILGRKK